VNRPTIGILHPGEMGAAVAAAPAAGGATVLWASAGRSPASAERARRAGLTDAGTVQELAREAAVILSVCPPHAAAEVARSVAGFRGVYVDANAISPAGSRALRTYLEDAGATYVDGGIVGPPPSTPGTTRLYLSGAAADEVAALFAGTPVDARVLSAEPGDASALKMAYAAWTKGSAALLLAVRATASAHGVDAALLEEWRLSQPDLEARSERAAASAAAKGWRWVAEMEEIAATFAAAGVPEGFHRAAADVFRQPVKDP
jgi:3-hydroxyisobutyrate dehydrogenase-like beta-hydroxyacid dehydrogenase